MNLLARQLPRTRELPLALRSRHQVPECLRKLRAVLLLGGSVRPSPLAAAIGRSVLDLPVGPELSLLHAWQLEVADLAQLLEFETLPLRLLFGQSCWRPSLPPAADNVLLQIDQDRCEYRGTAGILRDATEAYEDDDYVLVAGANQVMLQPLCELAPQLAEPTTDVVLLSRMDGIPCSVMLLRCSTLRQAPAVGYLDLKEQVLTRLARDGSVSVVTHRQASFPLRTLEGYISALRALQQLEPASAPQDPFTEDWRPVFSLAAPKARVASDARLHDSVVLDGGVVEPGAVLFDSLVCPGGIAHRGQTVERSVIKP